MNTKLLDKNFFLLILFIIYYFFSPILIFTIIKLFENNEFFLEHLFNKSYELKFRWYVFSHIHNYINYLNYFIFEFFSFLVLISSYYFLKIFFRNLDSFQNFRLNEPAKFIGQYKFCFTIIIIICIIPLIKDIYLLINYNLNHSWLNRGLIYYDVINNRKTYLNILIIISVCSFRFNYKLSYFVYFLVFTYDFFSVSRIDLFYLIILHSFVNIRLYSTDRKLYFKIFLIFLFLTLCIFFRIFLHKQNLINIFLDSIDIRHGSMIMYYNISNLSLLNYLIENIKFFLNDFFYFQFILKDFLYISFADGYAPHYAGRGVNFIISYFFVLIFYLYLLKYLLKNYAIPQVFIYTVYIFLIICLFRGNFVHNLNFIIKLYLLILFVKWLSKKISRLKYKVV
jgi:hypothetical protein